MIARMFARRCAGASCTAAVPMESLWSVFQSSPEYRVLQNASSSASDSSQELPPLTTWTNALARACYLWNVLVDDSITDGDHETSAWEVEEQTEMWDTICFLIKGTFYAANNLPLSRLQHEENDQFLLHAAVEALPLCCAQGDDDPSDAITIFHRVLRLCSDQLSQTGPVWNRWPLHIAATNKGSLMMRSCRINPPSKVDDVSKDFASLVLEVIFEQSPASAVLTPDAKGLYPFHLACASGFSWTSGLELLFRAAPQVSKLGSVPSLFVLMSESISCGDPDGQPIQKKKSVRNWMRKKVFPQQRQPRRCDEATVLKKNRNDNDAEAVNTIFHLLSTDPSAVNVVVQ